MKRGLRRSFRTLERKFSRARSYAASFVRSNSLYSYPSIVPRTTLVVTPTNSDSDDDTFAPALEELSPNEARRTSITFLPCEFCHEQQSSITLNQHQIRCRQNPHRRQARNVTPNITVPVPRRRAVSDNVLPKPTAPPRTRSPSPTEGFVTPEKLLCPITLMPFIDPVVASDGHTYERAAITQWLQQGKPSPITREPLSLTKIIPNRVVKTMVDEFRAECRQKRLLYQYKLDVDVKKTEQMPHIKTSTTAIYRAEWMKKDSLSTDRKIILLHLTGEHAAKIAESNCRVGIHPNIVRTFGRVEQNAPGILLVQECPSTQTLAQFMQSIDGKLSIELLDVILYQIASALQHLTTMEITHGNLTADHVLIYQLDGVPENTLVKLNNIGDVDQTNDNISSEMLSKEVHSDKFDVYAFGLLAQVMYTLGLETHQKDLTERKSLCERCLVVDPKERPTFNELSQSLTNFIYGEKCISKCASSV